MLSTALTFAQALAGRALPLLMALQDAPHTSGGGGGGGAAGGAAGGGGGGGGPGGALGGLMMPLLMIVMVAFLFMSGRKQRKESETMQKSLQKGDKVVTTSGIVATIAGIDDQYATLEIAEKVRVKFTRDAIARRVDATAGTAGAAAKKSDAKA
jgi:preprotein translocase subunit YajC